MVEKLLPKDPVLEDNDGMECATPEVYSPKKSSSDEELVAILMAKVKEAQDAGLSEDDVEALRALLLKHVDVFPGLRSAGQGRAAEGANQARIDAGQVWNAAVSSAACGVHA
jgi:hypothetical protein